MEKHEVVIAGGGPTGLMLAGELALAGIDVAIVERRTSQALVGSRAGGLHARSLEVLDQRGIAERFVREGKTHKFVHFSAPIDMSDLPTRHNYVLGLWQNHIERILAGWVDEFAVPYHRGRDVTGFTQDEEGVEVRLSDGATIRADYLAGCDGARSVVRKAAGIEFPGHDASTSWLIAEARTTEEPPLGFRHDALGTHAIGKREDSDRVGIVLTEREVGARQTPTLDEFREALVSIYGTDFGLHDAAWISRFSDMSRLAAAYRAGRVLIAGDAAHVHAPVGGQGLNVGLQDAMNLGWKLAQVVKGQSAPGLLDTYHAERHPVAARVLKNTMAQVALRRPDERSKAAAACMAELFAMDEPRRRIAAEVSGLDVHYDLGPGHPLLGRRMPDLDVVVDGTPTRVYRLLHSARPVLLDFDANVRTDGPWELPVIGRVDPPRAVLVRPDGHVAWVATGERDEAGLARAVETWFGTSPVNFRGGAALHARTGD